VFIGNLCVFVPVAQTVNCGIYWVFLKVCRNVIRQMSPELLCNILITTVYIHLVTFPSHCSSSWSWHKL